MLLSEYCPWNLLVYGLPKILSDNNGEIYNKFKKCNGRNERIEESKEDDPEWLSLWSDSFGRTLINRTVENRYLKIQSNTESDDEFKRGYARLKLIEKLGAKLEIESLIVKPKTIMHIKRPYSLICSDELKLCLFKNKKIFLEKVSKKPRLAMEFTAPSDVPYEEYSYGVVDDVSSCESLSKYSRDYAKLWKNGILPPSCLSAFHDVDRSRKHYMLSPFLNKKCEGSMEKWNGEATDYPNIGGPKMGMRDKVDTSLPEEKSDTYFGDYRTMSQSHNGLKYRNMIRYEELAKAAQGVCLLYARRFNSQFDHSSEESVGKIKKDIGDLLADLFSNAFPLCKSDCMMLMEEHDLLNQCCREISYWLAKDVPYVDDLRRGDINRKVYPNLPPEMQGCVLTKLQSDCLTNNGFIDIDKKKYKGDACQLGAQSGRMPLIALNALVVYLMTRGTIRQIEIEEQEMAENPRNK